MNFRVNTLITIIAFMAMVNCAVAGGLPGGVAAIKPNVYQLNGATDAVFSPDGRCLAVQYPGRFALLPAGNIPAALADPANLPVWEDRIIGFLPGSNLIFTDAAGTYSLDTLSFNTTRLLAEDISKYPPRGIGTKSMVIVSNDLLITGDGQADWDGRKVGNIIRIDLINGTVTRGTAISAFWYAALSPGGRYILYEHGAEDNNDVDFYDILADKNYRLSRYFDFQSAFPGYLETREIPLKWLNDSQFIASVSVDRVLNDPRRQLILFDIENRTMLWKTLTEVPVWPNQFALLNGATAFFNYPGKGFYRLSLTDGSIERLGGLGGEAFALSPDGKSVAFLEKEDLSLYRFSDGSRRHLLALAGWQAQHAYKGMQNRAPLWSPAGDALLLFGKSQLILIINPPAPI